MPTKNIGKDFLLLTSLTISAMYLYLTFTQSSKWEKVSASILAMPFQAQRNESHSGAWGNILAWPPNIFVGPLWEENF